MVGDRTVRVDPVGDRRGLAPQVRARPPEAHEVRSIVRREPAQRAAQPPGGHDQRGDVAELGRLEAKGARLLVCKSCLEHFGLEDRVSIGAVCGMSDVVAAIWAAEKVVTL